MKNILTTLVFLASIITVSAENRPEYQCQLRESSDIGVVSVQVDEDSIVTFSKDIGVEKATMNLFSREELPLFLTSETLDDDGKELFQMICNVDVDSSSYIEAMVLKANFEGVCLKCEASGK